MWRMSVCVYRSQQWRQLMDSLGKVSCEDYRNVRHSASCSTPKHLITSVCVCMYRCYAYLHTWLSSCSHWLVQAGSMFQPSCVSSPTAQSCHNSVAWWHRRTAPTESQLQITSGRVDSAESSAPPNVVPIKRGPSGVANLRQSYGAIPASDEVYLTTLALRRCMEAVASQDGLHVA